jgi:diguanylate cyclase (GGDEF)-like protein
VNYALKILRSLYFSPDLPMKLHRAIATGGCPEQKEAMRRFGSIRVLASLLAFSSVLPAQQYVFRSFRQADGLKNLGIRSMATDRSGFLWLATENSVYRFLGSGFERYGPEQGIAEVYVLDVISDPDGTIWVATQGNLYRWDGQRFFPAGRNPIRVDDVRQIAVEDARHLLIVQKGRVYRLEHDAEGKMLSFLPLFSDRMLASMPDLGKVLSLSVVQDSHSGLRVWAGCGSGLCVWQDRETGNGVQAQDGTVTEWGMDKGLAGDQWTDVLLDRTGTIWAAGFAHVAALPAGSAHFVDHSIHGPNLQGFYSHAPLIEDPEGRILAPAEDGLARWNGTAWQIIGLNNGLERAGHIMGMAFDAAGDLWLGSRGDGLYQWAGYGDWEGWSDWQGLPSASIWAIDPASADRVFVGTERGPGWVDPRNGTASDISSSWQWTWGQVRGIDLEGDGSLSVETLPGSILRVYPKTGNVVETAKISEPIHRAFVDSAGRLFLETFHGLYLSEPGRKAGDRRAAPHRIPAADALAGDSSQVGASCESPDGADWFGVGSHLLRFKGGRWSAPAIVGMSKQNGNMLALACAGDGTLWFIGALGDTWRLTLEGDRLQAWQLEIPPEMRTIEPWAIVVDRRGWVWLGSDMGLLVWNGQSWRHLTQESGLIWNDVDQGVMNEAPDGSLWIGTSGGLAHLLHPERAFDPIPLTVSLTKFQRGESNYLGARQITIPWAGPPLRFQASSPTMRDRSELALKIKMMGYQSEWMETLGGNATFAHLPPGSYTFMAMACNPGLSACSIPVKVDVTVLPPWWRTLWFYGLCGLGFLLLLAGSIELYVRHLRARSRQLAMLVAERTRELEASRAQLRIQATHDGLTGMLNREAVLRALTAEMDRAQRESQTIAVALIDLDHFKRINDEYGHLAGDEALRWFAAAVGAAIRAYDHAGRYGGEEFLLVLTQIPRDVIEQRLTNLHETISNLQVCARGSQFRVDCSMGATVFDPSDGAASVESLLAIADEGLYAAKAAGRNRVVFRPSGRMENQQGSPVQPSISS